MVVHVCVLMCFLFVAVFFLFSISTALWWIKMNNMLNSASTEEAVRTFSAKTIGSVDGRDVAGCRCRCGRSDHHQRGVADPATFVSSQLADPSSLTASRVVRHVDRLTVPCHTLRDRSAMMSTRLDTDQRRSAATAGIVYDLRGGG